VIDIPQEVVDEARNKSARLGTRNLEVQATPADLAIAAIGLEIGQVTLITEVLSQSLGALTVPLAFLLFSMIAVIVLGSITGVPVLLAGRRRRHWSVVLMSREATLPVRERPDYDSEIIYRYAATATGLLSTDKAEGSFIPVESPRGTGYVDKAYLTETVDLDYFMNDPRPGLLVRRLRDALETGDDIRPFVSPRGLVVALVDEPLLISPNRLIGSLGSTTPGRDTATVALQIDVFEMLRQALLDLADVTPAMAHSRAALIPVQLWNFPYLSIQAPGHSPWLIHFEYIKDSPYITGISLDQ
jgi:hypothetical protein